MSADCNSLQPIAAINVVFKKDVREIGFSLVCIETYCLHICEFRDDTSYTSLEAVLLQSRAIKCIVKINGDNPCEEKKISSVISRCNVIFELAPPYSEDFDSISRLLRSEEQSLKNFKGIDQLILGKQSLGYLIRATDVLTDSDNFKQFCLRIFPTNSFMRLDKETFSALNILPLTTGERICNHTTSLFGLLNQCRTKIGTNRLKNWIVQPSVDIKEIMERHQIVELFVKCPDIRQILRQDHFRHIPNLDQLLYKFHKAALKSVLGCTLNDILLFHEGVIQIYRLLAVLETLQEREHCNVLLQRFVEPLQKYLERLKRFNDLVEYTLDPEEARLGNAVIHRQFNKELEELANKKDQCINKMEQHRRQIENELPKQSKKFASDGQIVKLLDCNPHGYVFRVTKKDQRLVQVDPRRYKQIKINKAEFQFTTKELIIIVNDYKIIMEELETVQQSLAMKTISAAASYWPVIESLSDLIGTLDVLVGFSELASTSIIPYTRPNIYPSETGRIILQNARHPLLEVQTQLKRNDSSGQFLQHDIIPNSIHLEKPSRKVHLITGPNMGGKSTYIRQVGLMCLMAQIGSFVPCENADISIIDAILCRVGASDDQLKGVSTFFAEMIETSAILKSATKHSLILIDELGRGTSTSEGLALAWEVTKHIALQLDCFCIFATHFYEMNDLNLETPGIVNSKVSVQLSGNRLIFLYEVLPGSADNSYGIKVAEMAGLEISVVKRAKQISKALTETEERLTCSQEDMSTQLFKQLSNSLGVEKNSIYDSKQFKTHCFSNIEEIKQAVNALVQ